MCCKVNIAKHFDRRLSGKHACTYELCAMRGRHSGGGKCKK